jgi:hypothetical protein
MMMLIIKKNRKIRNSKRNISYLNNLRTCRYNNRCKDQRGDRSRNQRRILPISKETMTIIFGLISTSLIGLSKLKKHHLYSNATLRLIQDILRLTSLKRRVQLISVCILLEELVLRV